MKTELSIKNTIIYFSGMIGIALGVVLMLRSDLGNSSWDSLHYALHIVLPITMGQATIFVAVIATIIVIIMNRSYKYLYMAIPIIFVGQLIDLFNLVLLKDFSVTTLLPQMITFIGGIIILPMGGALLIVSTYPAGVFDELMLAIGRVLHSEKIVLIRVIMELTAVVAAYLIGVYAGFGLGKIYYGTLIFAFSVGICVKLFINIFERILKNEDKQTN